MQIIMDVQESPVQLWKFKIKWDDISMYGFKKSRKYGALPIMSLSSANKEVWLKY